VRKKLKLAGNLLGYFINTEIDDVSFGDIRTTTFRLISKDNIRILSDYLGEKELDTL